MAQGDAHRRTGGDQREQGVSDAVHGAYQTVTAPKPDRTPL
jgi:hypothetical protein